MGLNAENLEGRVASGRKWVFRNPICGVLLTGKWARPGAFPIARPDLPLCFGRMTWSLSWVGAWAVAWNWGGHGEGG